MSTALAALGWIGTVVFSAVVSAFVADRRSKKERNNYLIDERRRVFAAMLNAASDVLNSGNQEAWRKFREAKASFLLYASPSARAALASWQEALDQYSDMAAHYGEVYMETEYAGPDPFSCWDEFADVLRIELGDKSLQDGRSASRKELPGKARKELTS